MFFDKNLVKNKALAKVWRAANDQADVDGTENISLPEICKDLHSWVGSQDGDPRKRMSLRTSAVLIDGAAKTYKHGLKQLFEDVAKLDEEIITRNRTESKGSENKEVNSEESSESYDSPEQMRRQVQRQTDASFESNVHYSFSDYSETSSLASQPVKRKRSCTMEYIYESPKIRVTDPAHSRGSDKSSSNAYNIVSSDYPLSEGQSAERTSDKDVSSSDKKSCDDEGTSDKTSERELFMQQSESSFKSQITDDQTTDCNIDQTTETQEPEEEGYATSGQRLDRSQRESKAFPEPRVSSPTFTEFSDIVATLLNTNLEGKKISAIIEYSDDSSSIAIKRFSRDDKGSDRKSDGGNGVTGQTFDRLKTIIEINSDGSTTADAGTTFDVGQTNVVTEIYSYRDGRASLRGRSSDGDLRSERICDDGMTVGDTIWGDKSSESQIQRSIILPSTTKKKTKRRQTKFHIKQHKITKDQATQTVSSQHGTSEEDANNRCRQFNQNLPFGCLMIYDSYHSRIPSKFVFSSLDAEVKNLS